MRRVSVMRGLAVLVLALSPAWAADPPLPGVSSHVLKLVNDHRIQNGVSALQVHETLAATARSHAIDMLERGFFDHRNPDGRDLRGRLPRGFAARIVGENLWRMDGWRGQSTEEIARRMFNRWLGSRGHVRNILDPAYTHTGIYVALDGDQIRAVQVFAGIRER